VPPWLLCIVPISCGHLDRALDNGVTKDELGELITHLAFYSGWPTAVTAAGIAKEIFDKRQ
jgi:4-carboxymuconolactone decarboxylase